MALIQLNPNNLHVEVRVGIEESYKPNKQIKDFYKNLTILKDETYKFLKDSFNTLEIEEINKIISKNEDKKKLWQDYLNNTYVVKFNKLKQELDKINEKICPNYSDIKAG